MEEGVKWFAGLGVGGVLAGMIFWFYRQDSAEWAAELTAQRAAAHGLIVSMMQVIKENSVAITANTQTIEALHRRDDRIEDALTNLGYRFPHRGTPREDYTK
jgi:hypothetical protein